MVVYKVGGLTRSDAGLHLLILESKVSQEVRSAPFGHPGRILPLPESEDCEGEAPGTGPKPLVARASRRRAGRV
jgi:hypothetical protein